MARHKLLLLRLLVPVLQLLLQLLHTHRGRGRHTGHINGEPRRCTCCARVGRWRSKPWEPGWVHAPAMGGSWEGRIGPTRPASVAGVLAGPGVWRGPQPGCRCRRRRSCRRLSLHGHRSMGARSLQPVVGGQQRPRELAGQCTWVRLRWGCHRLLLPTRRKVLSRPQAARRLPLGRGLCIHLLPQAPAIPRAIFARSLVPACCWARICRADASSCNAL